MSANQKDIVFRERLAREGRKGGLETFRRHGKDYYSRIAKKGWAKRRKTKDVDK